MHRFIPLIALALVSLNAQAGLHKWTDADGKVHYSDSPPAEQKSQPVRSYTGSGQNDGATTPEAPKSLAEREADLKKSREANAEAEKKKAEEAQRAAEKKRYCDTAQVQLQALESGVRMADHDGSIMEDSTRAQRLAETRASISKNCN